MFVQPIASMSVALRHLVSRVEDSLEALRKVAVATVRRMVQWHHWTEWLTDVASVSSSSSLPVSMLLALPIGAIDGVR